MEVQNSEFEGHRSGCAVLSGHKSEYFLNTLFRYFRYDILLYISIFG
jgi:hypothetical protein